MQTHLIIHQFIHTIKHTPFFSRIQTQEKEVGVEVYREEEGIREIERKTNE